jgi:hypothetical protein
MTPASTTKIEAGTSTILITLSSIGAYYDVENTLNNNNFCSIGLDIKVWINGTLNSQLVFSPGDADFSLAQSLTFTSTAKTAQ